MQIFKSGDAYASKIEQLKSGRLNLRHLLGGDGLNATADRAKLGPQAFLASFLPAQAGDSIPRRSYPFPQFQVVMNGEATVGRYLVRPGSFHYSDAYSTSGPITPLDPDVGLTYFTLRPDNANQRTSTALPVGNGQTPIRRSIVGSRVHGESRTDTSVSELVGPEDDGLGVCSVTVPANTTFTPTCQASHGGKYLIVLEGIISHAGTDLATGSLVYLASGETADFTAAEEGSELLLLQFPTMEYSP